MYICTLKSHYFMRKLLFLLAAILLMAACETKHERAQREIAERKAALKHKQDSALQAAQQELAWVDSALQQANQTYDQLNADLQSGKWKAVGSKLMEEKMTTARLHRDSLQVRFDVLCSKIKYIHRRQKE